MKKIFFKKYSLSSNNIIICNYNNWEAINKW